MSGFGESTGMDFNFEDLEFINGDLDDLGGKGDEGGQDPNQMTTEEIEAEEAAAAVAADKEAAKVAKAGLADDDEEEEEEDTTEEEDPEGVSSKAAGGKKGEGAATSPLLYQSLANVLRDEGVLSAADESSLENVKDVKGLVDLIKAQIQAEEFSDLSEVQRTVLDDMRKGVDPASATTFKKSMDSLNGLDSKIIEADKQVRFDLIYQDLLSKGFEKGKAEKLANRSFDTKEDVADAIEAKASLIAAVTARYEKSKEADMLKVTATATKKESEKAELKKKILESGEVIKGFDIPDKVRKEVYEEMVKTVSNNPDTGVPENSLMKFQRENPVDYSHKLYYLYKVTNGFKDMEYFKGKKTTSSVSALEKALRQSTHVSGGGDVSYADDLDTHSLDIGDLVLPGS
jgi:hypothetical protein